MHFQESEATCHLSDSRRGKSPALRGHSIALLLWFVAGCSAPAPQEAMFQRASVATPSVGLHGFMIVSDADASLALNAYGGAREGAPIKLFRGCTKENGDCTWSYRDGMLISDGTDIAKGQPWLKLTTVGAASQGAGLQLTSNCTSDNPDCTWTYRNGTFVSDRNPALAINAWGGAQHLADVKLHDACPSNKDNPDCAWTAQRAFISSDSSSNLTSAMRAFDGFTMNAWGGAKAGTELKLTTLCTPSNLDCTFTLHRGRMLSDHDPALAVNASGGALHGGHLKLFRDCPESNADCTWTFKNGMILSDKNTSLAINAWGGAKEGTDLRLHDSCTVEDVDCTFRAQVSGEQCGHIGQQSCAGRACMSGLVDSASICVKCGNLGQVCCANRLCNDRRSCDITSNTCGSPEPPITEAPTSCPAGVACCAVRPCRGGAVCVGGVCNSDTPPPFSCSAPLFCCSNADCGLDQECSGGFCTAKPTCWFPPCGEIF